MSDLRDKFNINMYCTKLFGNVCINNYRIFESTRLFMSTAKPKFVFGKTTSRVRVATPRILLDP